MIIMLSVGLMNHVIIIPLLLEASKRDAWLVVLLVFVASPVWIGCLNYIIQNMNNQHMKKWLDQHFGKFLSAILVIIYSLLLWLMGFISLKDTLTWTIASYLPQTPILVLAGTTLVASFFAAFQGLRTIAIVSGILLPFVVILGHLVAIANFQFKDYTLLFPLLENGTTPLWKGVPYVAGGLLELSFLMLLIQHKLTKKTGFKSLMLMCFILTGLTLGPLMGSIAIFGPDEAANQRYPAYAQWRIVRLGEYVEHVNFFFDLSVAIRYIYSCVPFYLSLGRIVEFTKTQMVTRVIWRIGHACCHFAADERHGFSRLVRKILFSFILYLYSRDLDPVYRSNNHLKN